MRASLLGDATPDTGCGLKLILRSAYLELPFFDHMHRFLPALVQRNGGATLSVEVNHRPRTRGVSNYGLFDRLWIGIVDLFGVMWLQRPRQTRPPAGDRVAQALKVKTYLPGLVFLATLIAIGYLIESGLLRGMLSEAWIDQEVRGQGMSGELLFIAAGGIVTAPGRAAPCGQLSRRLCFGLGLGTVLALLATELGCLLVFFYGRFVGRPLVSARMSEKMRARVHRIEEFSRRQSFLDDAADPPAAGRQ